MHINADFTEFKADENLEAIRQEHEPFLTELEALAVQAIASNNWDPFYAHVVDFQNEYDLHGESVIAIGEASDRPSNLRKYFPNCEDKAEASTKSLSRSGADLLPNDQQNESIRTNSNHVTTRTNTEPAGANGVSEPAGDNAANA
jgi:hypothetical protein